MSLFVAHTQTSSLTTTLLISQCSILLYTVLHCKYVSNNLTCTNHHTGVSWAPTSFEHDSSFSTGREAVRWRKHVRASNIDDGGNVANMMAGEKYKPITRLITVTLSAAAEIKGNELILPAHAHPTDFQHIPNISCMQLDYRFPSYHKTIYSILQSMQRYLFITFVSFFCTPFPCRASTLYL